VEVADSETFIFCAQLTRENAIVLHLHEAIMQQQISLHTSSRKASVSAGERHELDICMYGMEMKSQGLDKSQKKYGYEGNNRQLANKFPVYDVFVTSSHSIFTRALSCEQTFTITIRRLFYLFSRVNSCRAAQSLKAVMADTNHA
jgi:hypothetical protein